jgi:hypothetical protein
MYRIPLSVKALIGILAMATPALAQRGQMSPQMQRGPMQRPEPNAGGYLPWVGYGFAPTYTAPSNNTQQAETVNLAPAQGEAAFADTIFSNRWADLQVLIDRARKDFEISDDYLSARNDAEQAQQAYDVAVDSVMSRLLNDADYKSLIEKKTEEKIALTQTPIGSGIRNAVANEKLRYGSMASQMEAVALANDSAVQDARSRMISADQNLRMKVKQFESDLYKRPEIVAAKQQMEVARANKSGADSYLDGMYLLRADQLFINDNLPGNSVYFTPGWW